MRPHEHAGHSDQPSARQPATQPARSTAPLRGDLTEQPVPGQSPVEIDERGEIDGATATLLSLVPELRTAYLELVELVDDDPGPAAVFAELAALVAGWLASVGQTQPALDRAFRALEAVAEDASEEALELVGYAFFDNLSPDEQRAAQRWIGPCTRAMMEVLDG